MEISSMKIVNVKVYFTYKVYDNIRGNDATNPFSIPKYVCYRLHNF
jgi:hypothetical protein